MTNNEESDKEQENPEYEIPYKITESDSSDKFDHQFGQRPNL
jgi:hypothetical protein